MKVAREETFGPLAAVFRFTDEAEAVHLANDTEYGLAAYCYTKDLGRAWRMSESLEYGMVGINGGLISTRWPPSAASSHRAWAVKALNTVSKTIWRSSTA